MVVLLQVLALLAALAGSPANGTSQASTSAPVVDDVILPSGG